MSHHPECDAFVDRHDGFDHCSCPELYARDAKAKPSDAGTDFTKVEPRAAAPAPSSTVQVSMTGPILPPADSAASIAFTVGQDASGFAQIAKIHADGRIESKPDATADELRTVLVLMAQLIHTQLMVPHQRRCKAEGRPIGLYFAQGSTGAPIPPV